MDEDAIKAGHWPASTPPDWRVDLARAKALAVSRHDADGLVLGADQTLDFDGGLVSKAPDLAEARGAAAGPARPDPPAAFRRGPGRATAQVVWSRRRYGAH